MAGNFNTIPGNTPLQAGGAIIRKDDDTGFTSRKIPVVKSDIGLSNVDNTSDINKPISAAVQTALETKEPLIDTGPSSQYWRGDKTWQTLDKSTVGLGASDNTSDVNKPLSTAAIAALATKVDTTSLAQVAFSGIYNDLTGKPVIPAPQVNSDWNAPNGVTQILNKPTLASVATSGAYNDLTGKPTIPSAQIQSDWNQANISSLDYIKNKPTIPSIPVTSVNSKTGAVVLNTTDIAEGTNLYYTDARIASYLNAQGYLKTKTFLGTTDASGTYTVSFGTTYATAPDVQPQIVGGTFNQFVRVTSVSTTGCVIQVAQRNTVTLLGIEVLLGATVAVSGASVTVQVTSRA